MSKDQFNTQLQALIAKFFLAKAEKTSVRTIDILNNLQELNEQLLAQFNELQNVSLHKNFEIAKNYQHWKLTTFESTFSEKGASFNDLELADYQNELESLIKTQPRVKKLNQKKARFYISTGDQWWVKAAKRFKRVFFYLYTIPQKTANLTRRLFGKKERNISYWQHTIPYQKLLILHFKKLITYRIREIINEFNNTQTSILNEALNKEQVMNNLLMEWSVADQIEESPIEKFRIEIIEGIKKSRSSLRKLKQSLAHLIENQHEHLALDSELAGTVEYPNSYLNLQVRKKKVSAPLRLLGYDDKGWGNTVFALFEDWKIDQEIYNLNYFSQQKTRQVQHENRKHQTRLIELLEKSTHSLTTFNQELVSALKANASDDKEMIRKALDGIQHEEFKKWLDESLEVTIGYNSPEHIDQMEYKIVHFLGEIAQKRWLTSQTGYDKPLESSDLSSFSPRELISFEYLPVMTEACNMLKARLTKEIEQTHQDIENLEHIVAFNLSSIIESIDRRECKNSEIPALINKGIERSQNKLHDIIEQVKKAGEELSRELSKIVEEFNQSNLKLTSNENAFNLRMIVVKAKTLKKGEQIGYQFLYQARTGARYMRKQSYEILQKFSDWILPWKKRIGLEVESGIATELSDFLAEANKKINSLPIIYQRLYKILPLTEMSFFTGRKSEYAILSKAYENWKDGNYASTVITGEKWSGHSSLINYFLSQVPSDTKALRIELKANICSSKQFIELWQDTLTVKDISTIDDVVNKASKQLKGKIVIVEDLQNFYLRKIHGFETLKALTYLISKTAHDIFWLCSVNIYPWSYLKKTVNLSGYFGYVVNIQPFSDKELREIIMKKNNISGYKIIFNPSERNRKSKKFSQLSAEEQQLYLRDQFFNDLNDFAKGNISLALSFWLLSTTNITDESIEISNFIPPDFSFIKNLGQDIVFILHQVIMHDGIGLLHLAETLQEEIGDLNMKLMMLCDDGLLVQKENEYRLNPLIYRHTISMLRAKNLIH